MAYLSYLGKHVTLVVLSSCMVEETHLKNNVCQRFHPLPLPFGLIQVKNHGFHAHKGLVTNTRWSIPDSMGHWKGRYGKYTICMFISMFITHCSSTCPAHLAAQLDIALSIPSRCLLHVPRHPLRRPVGCFRTVYSNRTGQHPSQV